MLTQVDVVKGDGTDDLVLSLPIAGATPKSSLLVQKITGFDPPDLTLFIGDYSRDGGNYQGRRAGNRNPVFLLKLNPDPTLGETVSSQREMLYKAFYNPLPEADFVKFNLHDDAGRVLYAVGYAEKFECDIFSGDTVAQISVICPDPYIRDNEETVLSNDPGWTTVPFTYAGTAKTGFVTTIQINIATPALTLENNGKTMVLERAFAVDDVVEICTVRGSRSLYVTPDGGGPTSIIASLTPESQWLELSAQANTMKVYGETTGDLVAAIRELRYTQAYWGV